MKDRGFTLIEILLAVGIFALVATIAYGRSGDAMRQAARLEDRTFAEWVAQNALTAVDIQQSDPPQPLPTGRRSQVVRFANRDWRVTTEVSSTSHPTLQRIEVNVRADGDGDDAPELAGLVGFHGVF